MKSSTYISVLLCLLSISFAPAQDRPSAVKEGAGELDLTKFPGQVVDDVIVPVPSEIFGVLDKLGDPDWKKEMNGDMRVAFTERSDIALLMGMVVAEGFVAVQAEDAKAVENVGRDVLNLAKGLGVEKSVIPHCNAIQEGATSKNWEQVRNELDATQRTVREQMEKMKDGALAECISVGGWLRGTQVVTNIVSKRFTPEQAELLNQPDLTEYFRDTMEEAITKLAKPEKLKLVSSGLAQIHDLMTKSGPNLSQESVETIQRITSELVNRITAKN